MLSWRVASPALKNRCFSEQTSRGTGEKEGALEKVSLQEVTEVTETSGLPRAQVGRKARIFMPARHAMQSGSHNTRTWRLEFENQERWENPLMGWASSGDPLSNVTISFDSKEQAVAFAIKNGFTYEVMEPKQPKFRLKSYGENFSWDKRTRVTSK